MTDPITPKQLSLELGVEPRRIRAFLRSEYGRRVDAFETRWNLTDAQASEVRERFANG